MKEEMQESLRRRLEALAEEDYRRFSSALVPGVRNMLGVRLPALRTVAKELARGDWRAYLATARDDTFEEIMLQGMVIGLAAKEIEEMLEYARKFIPKIDNWSVCDSFCCGLKTTARHRDRVWEFIGPFLRSKRPYEIRFGVVMLLGYYADGEYTARALQLLDGIRHDDYYVKMAVAWAISVFYVKQPEITGLYLLHNRLDDLTFNKALQKIIESRRCDAARKSRIRALKRPAAGKKSDV